MVTQNKIKEVLAFIALAVMLHGCGEESSIKTPENNYLLSMGQANTLLLPAVEALLIPLEATYPEAAFIRTNAAYGVQVYRITYKTHYRNEEITASGLVCMPLADESFPVISFQNGTNTQHENAPSEDPLDFNYMLLQAMASNGYIILIPDYIGFGASDNLVHPYYQKESTTEAVIDMIHASLELLDYSMIPAKSNENLYLMGYSQGGWATLCTMDALEQNNQTGLTLSGVSCGSGAYDLIAMSNYVLGLSTFPGPLYLPYFVYAQQEFGALTDPLDKYFKQPYADNIPALFNGALSNGEVNAQLNDTIARLLTDNMIENFQTGSEFATLRNLLTINSVTAWNTTIPLRFFHGTADTNIPSAQSVDMHHAFIQQGSDPGTVTFTDLEGYSHETGIIPWGIATVNWLNEILEK
jgi:pimeloyl-ACP methyl ester carboxylesterase